MDSSLGHRPGTAALRWLGLDRNPLRRGWHRVVGTITLVWIAGMLLTVPVAGVVGSAVYQGAVDRAKAQVAATRQVTALLVQDAPYTDDAASALFEVRTAAAARWQDQDGSPRQGTVPAAPGTRAGSAVPVWLDPTGTPTSRPYTEDELLALAVVAALVTLFGSLTVLVAVRVGSGWLLDRYRLARWDAEWKQIGPLWTNSR